MFTIGDYALISTYVKRYGKDNNVDNDSLAFYFFVLDMVLNLADDDARDAIIDKIEGFLNKLMLQEENIKDEINTSLYSKVEEIWEIFKGKYPRFIFHIVANYQNSFENSEKSRFERCINKYSNFEINYILAEKIVDIITKRNRKRINAKIRAIGTQIFDRSDGDIRAMVADFYALDILRMLADDESTRNNVGSSEYERIKDITLCEDAFEDNVRLYLAPCNF